MRGGINPKGVFLTTQLNTAISFANTKQHHNGYAILRMTVSVKDWTAFVASNPGVVFERPIPQPLQMGQTETIIPYESVVQFVSILKSSPLKINIEKYQY